MPSIPLFSPSTSSRLYSILTSTMAAAVRGVAKVRESQLVEHNKKGL